MRMPRILAILTVCLAIPALADLLPVEPRFQQLLWNLHNEGQTSRPRDGSIPEAGVAGADIDVLEAWRLIDSSPHVLVAVIDGGFDLRHPDLDGVFDLAGAFDFLNDGPLSPERASREHHGTAVAGIIGAIGTNDFGITGISRRARILPLEVVPPGHLNERDEDVARAVFYAVEKGARVINCSFGKKQTSPVIAEALEFAARHGVLVVAAAGNSGMSVDELPYWPAGYSRTLDNVISVAATDRLDRLWRHSSRGLTVDIAAPGHEILTTGDPSRASAAYSEQSGSSMAAPHVTAVAALMIELYPQIRAEEIKKILLDSADRLPALNGKVKTGRLNAGRALRTTLALRQKANRGF